LRCYLFKDIVHTYLTKTMTLKRARIQMRITPITIPPISSGDNAPTIVKHKLLIFK